MAISGRHCRFVPAADKTYNPIASVAAVTAQPLAALPPYGCGVPFTGSDRLAGWQCLPRKFIGAMPSSLSLRGGRRPTWQSRSTRPDHRKAIGENAAAFPRLHPKGTSSRFALRAPRPLRGLAMTRPEAFRILHFSVFRIHSFPCPAPTANSPARHKKAPIFRSELMLALPIFPCSHPQSIVGANELNFCVRDGNRCTLTAINTNYLSVFRLLPENIHHYTTARLPCQALFW